MLSWKHNRNPEYNFMRRLLLVSLLLTLVFTSVQAQDNTATPEPIPEPMPLIDEGDQDIVNILLIGAATNNPNNPGLTDSLMVVSVNRTAGAVSVVSIPRDLYVLLPGYTMQKLTTAYFYGENNLGEGGGIKLLLDTIRYNLGLNIDFYARVNFTGFNDIIDSVGGIDITVDCVIRDWKLKSPELDKQVADNYEMFIMRVGRWHMDSELALWYVRSRKTSSDLDRGRRQQDVLRALWRKIRAGNLLETLPQTWAALTESVTTNMTLADAVGMLPLVANLDTSDIRYFTFHQKHEVKNAVSPAGQSVLLPQREAITEMLQLVVLPPTASQIRPQRPTVAVVNASGVPTLDLVAADRLELEGFRTTVIDEGTVQYREFNHVVDYSGATKGSPLGKLTKVLRVTDDGIEITPDSNRDYDYKVYVGAMYQYWSCTRDVIQPTPEQLAEATQEGG
ncbi:MAG: LCP family protein [Anaerolineae bacterium]